MSSLYAFTEKNIKNYQVNHLLKQNYNKLNVNAKVTCFWWISVFGEFLSLLITNLEKEEDPDTDSNFCRIINLLLIHFWIYY